MAALEMIASGYGLVEGPRVDADGGVYFSDVHDGGVRRLGHDGTLDVVVPKRRGVGGIALHADGGIIVSGRDISHVRDGTSRVVFAPDAPGLNDLITDSAGRVICATVRSNPFSIGAERTPGETWLIDLDGTAHELYGDVSLTNGLGFSADGAVLYHSDTTVGIWAHDYDDGQVSNRRLFVAGDGLRKHLAPDGLAVDEAGTVWVADVSGSGAVRGFAADGNEIGQIDVPARMVTSVCFGGTDRRDLYIVTGDNTDDPTRRGTIFRTRADTPGVPIALAAVG